MNNLYDKCDKNGYLLPQTIKEIEVASADDLIGKSLQDLIEEYGTDTVILDQGGSHDCPWLYLAKIVPMTKEEIKADQKRYDEQIRRLMEKEALQERIKSGKNERLRLYKELKKEFE